MDTLFLDRIDVCSEQFAEIVAFVAKSGRTGTEITSVPQALSLTGRQAEAGVLPNRFYHQKWWWGPS
jgi:hypothetical protein